MSKWRKARDSGALQSLAGKNKGKSVSQEESSGVVKTLLREKAKLERKLETTNAVIENKFSPQQAAGKIYS